MSTQPVVDPEGSATSRRHLLTGAVATGAGALALSGTQTAQAAVSDGSFYSYGPTRFVDTRSGNGGRISRGQTRTLTVLAGAEFTMACNITVTATTGSGYLAFYSADLATRPSPYSTVNWSSAGATVANFAMFDLGNAGFSVYCGGGTGASAHFIVDTIGYFLNDGAGGAARRGPGRR